MNIVARTIALCAIAIAANTASAAALTESSVRAMLAAMDQAIEKRNVEGVGRLLSSDFSMTQELTAYGQKNLVKADKVEYLRMLRANWAAVSAYKYERTHLKITMLPGDASAKVTAQVRETLTLQGQSVSAVSTETATVKLIDGQVLLTGVTAVMQDPSMTP
jgi:hypothetical protein